MENLSVPLSNISLHETYRIKYGPWTDHVHTDAERYVGIAYFAFALPLSLIGNTIILIATIKYKAIKLDKVTSTLIQHLAVSDLGNAIIGIVPSLTSLITDRWVFGALFCDISTYIRMVFYYSSVFLICALNSCKLLLLLFPIEARLWSKRTGHLVAAAAWSIFIIFQIILFICKKYAPIFFEYRIMACWYVPPDLGFGFGFAVLIFLGLFGFVPILIVLGTTGGLLIVAFRVARRGRDSLQWQGVVTVLSIAGIYCVAYLPFFTYHLVYNNLFLDPEKVSMSTKTKALFYLQLFTITNAISYLNNFANIFIYYISIASFKRFIQSKLSLVLQAQSSSSHRQSSNSKSSNAVPSGSTQQSTL